MTANNRTNGRFRVEEDALGNVVTSFHGSVTLALVDYGNSGATLGGTLTVTAVNGVATFSGLTINRAGYFAVSAAGTGLGGATTNAFRVTPSTGANLPSAPGAPTGTAGVTSPALGGNATALTADAAALVPGTLEEHPPRVR